MLVLFCDGRSMYRTPCTALKTYISYKQFFVDILNLMAQLQRCGSGLHPDPHGSDLILNADPDSDPDPGGQK